MKKYLFIALAAAGMLSSCSSDDTVANERTNGEELVPIKIGMGNVVTNVTRGTGSVGAAGATTTNKWNGELVQIYMFDQGTLDLAQNGGAAIYDDEEFQTPAGEDGSVTYATATSGETKFYPASGNFDFFGYRTDGAETAAPALNAAGDAYTVPVAITGSEDVMAAQCDKAAAAAALDAAAGTTGTTKFFSAYSARKDVNPELNFKHMLSRLTFQVKAGNADAADATYPVQITAIRVYSKTTGELVFASTANAFEPTINWDAADATTLTGYTKLELKENADADGDGNLDALNIFSLAGTNVAWDPTVHAIGEALLVAPGDHTYRMEIAMKQTKVTWSPAADPTTGEEEINMDPYVTDITIPGAVDAVAEAGSSYNVQVIVYGLEEIKVKTILAPWVDGGNVEIDPDANI